MLEGPVQIAGRGRMVTMWCALVVDAGARLTAPSGPRLLAPHHRVEPATQQATHITASSGFTLRRPAAKQTELDKQCSRPHSVTLAFR